MFELELSTDGAAFDEPIAQFDAIFPRLVGKIQRQDFTPGEWEPILDSNGNACGRWRWAP